MLLLLLLQLLLLLVTIIMFILFIIVIFIMYSIHVLCAVVQWLHKRLQPSDETAPTSAYASICSTGKFSNDLTHIPPGTHTWVAPIETRIHVRE